MSDYLVKNKFAVVENPFDDGTRFGDWVVDKNALPMGWYESYPQVQAFNNGNCQLTEDNTPEWFHALLEVVEPRLGNGGKKDSYDLSDALAKYNFKVAAESVEPEIMAAPELPFCPGVSFDDLVVQEE